MIFKYDDDDDNDDHDDDDDDTVRGRVLGFQGAAYCRANMNVF